jgi:diguanylate cyclase (GGDEF)-like protein
MSFENQCLELVGTIDVEVLQEKVLEELCQLCGAQSGVLWVEGDRVGLRLRAWKGLVDRAMLPEVIDPSMVQPHAWQAGNVLLVPLFVGGDMLGLVQLSDSIAGGFRKDLLGAAQLLGQFAAAALKGAIRFAQVQRQGLRDRETGAYTLSYFTDYATKEIYKARRYGRSFSLLTLSLDNLPQLRARLGHDVVRRVQKIALRVLSEIVRDSDVVARASEQEFHVLLAETDFFGGLMFLRRSLLAIQEDPEAQAISARLPLGFTGGAATFPRDGDDFDEILARCRRRMEERRGSLHHHLKLESLSFWDEVELLLGNARSPKLPTAAGDPSRRGKVADVLFDELQVEIARELLRDPSSRGLLYLGLPTVRSDVSLLRALEHAPREFAPRIYLLGWRADLGENSIVTPIFLDGDDRLARHEFLLWLGDGAAYAVLQRRGRGATWGFHTSDPTLVEALVSKLQAEYQLQPF